MEDPRSKLGFEIHGSKITVVSSVENISPVPINKGKINLHMDNHLKYRPLVLRNPKMRAIFKIQEGVITSYSIHYTKLYDFSLQTVQIPGTRT